jgi:hypothetical protein
MYSKANTARIACLVLCFALGFCLILLGQITWAAPKLLPNAKTGDCGACHGKEKVLPSDHPGTKAMSWKGCVACHAKGGKMSLVGKISGSHIHHLQGVNCVGCHGKTRKPEEVPMAKCVSCHGSADALAQKTASVKPENPHTSPHYGTTLDCNLCHRQHAKSEDYCAQCHNFNFKTP